MAIPRTVRVLALVSFLTDVAGEMIYPMLPIFLVGLAIASPVMAVAATLIRLGSKGPVIFTQQRAGLGGRPFTIFKFRTMVVDAEEQKAALRKLSEQDAPLGTASLTGCDVLPTRFKVANSLADLSAELPVIGAGSASHNSNSEVAAWAPRRSAREWPGTSKAPAFASCPMTR